MILGVPYDAEVEYLESTGMQYIDTGELFRKNIMLKMSVEYTATSFSGWGLNRNGYEVLWQNTAFYFGNGRSTVEAREVNVKYDYDLNFTQGAMVAKINGVTVRQTQGTQPTDGSILLFACYNHGNITRFSGRHRYLQMWDETGKIRDMIPVRVGSVGYMYDRVTRRLFGNQGTGAFVLGPDVATPVISFRHMAWQNPYVKDGLVAMWDGEWNAGWGVHDASATTWKNLIGSSDITIPSVEDMYWGASYLHRGMYGTLDTGIGVVENNTTTEMVVDVLDGNNASANGRFFGAGSGSRFEVDAYSQRPTDGPRYYVRYNGASANSSVFVKWGLEDWQRVWCIGYSLSDSDMLIYDTAKGKTFNSGRALDYSYTAGNSLLLGCWKAGNTIYAPLICNIHSVRRYNRVLDAAEIAHNHRIDKLRFNLPS